MDEQMVNKNILMDTTVLIDHLRKKRKDPTLFYQITADYDVAISAITEFEFRVGATLENRAFIEEMLDTIPITPFSTECVECATQIYHELKRQNQLIELPDILIAATALTHEMPLLTLNRKHFMRVANLILLER